MLTWTRLGQCYVTIEGSGSSPDPQARAILSDLQTMAFKLVERCVKGNNGSGGYGVSGFQAFLDWVLHDPNPQIPPWHAPPPVSASFLTVTISDASYRRPSPGNNNPSIALTVYQSLRKLHHDFPDVDTQYPNVLKKADYWWRLSQTIPEDGRTPWWTIQMPETQQETTYECDASLGSPADCSEVEWNLLGPGGAQSDTVTVGSGAVTFLHSNTCYLAISAFTSLVLTWEQIRAAATTLISVCTQNPWQAPQGGRAYGGPQPQRTSGRSRERKTRVPSVNSLNALPRGVNVTIFKQQEPWINQAAELKSCAWKAVLKQTPTSPCGPA